MHHALLYLLATLAGSMLTALVYAVHKKAEGGRIGGVAFLMPRGPAWKNEPAYTKLSS